MKLIAIMPARNEEWVIGLSARAALMWCDALVVLNHASTDQTRNILEEIRQEGGALTILDESDGRWAEMAHRQRLLEAARDLGATHVALVDADEVLTGCSLDRIRWVIERLPRPGAYLRIRMHAMWRGIDRYRNDTSTFGRNAVISVAFCDAPGLSWRARRGYDFHHREPYGSHLGHHASAFGVMHLQFADRRRLLAKHALYKMIEVVRWPGRRSAAEIDRLYNLAPAEDEAMLLGEAPQAWWAPYSGILHHLSLGSVPWQEAECRRLWNLHGPTKFHGLNLFGIVGEGECRPAA